MTGSEITGRKLNKVDWIGVFASVLIGIAVTDAVGNRVEETMDFWPAFGIKTLAGSVVTLVILSIWLGLIRRK